MTEQQRLEAAKALESNPYVERITEQGFIVLKKDFRDSLYFAWKFRQSASTIEKILVKVGLGWRVTGKEEKSKALHKAFKKKFAKSKIKDEQQQHIPEDVRDKTKDELVKEGILQKAGRGYRFTKQFIELAEKRYPEFTPTDILYEWGIYPENVGMRLINALTEKLEKSVSTEQSVEQIAQFTSEATPEPATEQPESIANIVVVKEDEQSDEIKLSVIIMKIPATVSNPYIIKDSDGTSELSEAFYNEAKIFLKYFDIETILDAFGLTQDWIKPDEILKNLRWWIPTNNNRIEVITMLEYRIRGSKIVLMREAADERFAEIKACFKKLQPEDRKEVCMWLSQLPEMPGQRYCIRSILSKCGIPKSIFYRYIGEEKYGLRIAERMKEDERVVRAAFNYKGYAKGSRQISMLIPRISPGKKMGYKKVLEIMRRLKLDCGVRKNKCSENHSAFAGEPEPNFLQRRFRLHRPNQVRVTDVTYLHHAGEDGKDTKSYGSALMDPVTRRVIDFVISDENNFLLMTETMQAADKYPCEDGGIFHSDKGILYRLKKFKEMVKERGLLQSMSREGNCFDNAVIESFFGHFKVEVSVSFLRRDFLRPRGPVGMTLPVFGSILPMSLRFERDCCFSLSQ